MKYLCRLNIKIAPEQTTKYFSVLCCIFFLLLCVCVCIIYVLAFVGVCISVQVIVWRLEINSGCFLCSPLYIFLRHSPSQNWKLIDSATLAGHWAPGILFSITGIISVCGHLPSSWGPHIWSLVLMLPGQALYDWALSPVLKSHFSVRGCIVYLNGVTTNQCVSRTNTNDSRQFSPNHLFLGHTYKVSVPNTR